MDRLGMEEGEPIEHKLVTRAIGTAQKRVETRNFEIRKHLLEYDDVMNKQREIVYGSVASPEENQERPCSSGRRGRRGRRRRYAPGGLGLGRSWQGPLPPVRLRLPASVGQRRLTHRRCDRACRAVYRKRRPVRPDVPPAGTLIITGPDGMAVPGINPSENHLLNMDHLRRASACAATASAIR
jgi:hypothetical protein